MNRDEQHIKVGLGLGIATAGGILTTLWMVFGAHAATANFSDIMGAVSGLTLVGGLGLFFGALYWS